MLKKITLFIIAFAISYGLVSVLEWLEATRLFLTLLGAIAIVHEYEKENG